MKKYISILGSTGSIGLNTLSIVSNKKSNFKTNILAADKNYNLICKQIVKFKPRVFLINNFKTFQKVKKRFKNQKVKIINKLEPNGKNLKRSFISVAAIPGIAGLKPTLELITKSDKVLIANKESVICGWELIKKTATKYKTKLVPIDSEHFSIMKILDNHNISDVKKIYLTASGGPFLNYNISKLKNVKPHLAIKHPKWKMGKKISVDSATLMNKLLEVIEAHKLFNINLDKIDIIIHPQSLVHAIIEFKNGLFKFIYHETTMLIPLINAMLEKNFIIDDYLNNKKDYKDSIFFQNLNFLKVDRKKFPIVQLKNRLNEFASTPIIINAANEILVDLYLRKRISFSSFYKYLLKVLKDRNYRKYAIKEPKNINEIFHIDKWSRNTTIEMIDKKYE